MKTESLILLAVAAMMFTVTAGCNNQDKSAVTANTSNTTALGSSDGGSASVTPDSVNGSSATPTLAEEERDEALILRSIKEVWIKEKGAQEFIRILTKTPFRSGDILRIGTDSKAVIFCSEVCELSTGTYTACCTQDCILAARITSNSTAGPRLIMKKDLSTAEAQSLADSESSLQALGLGETTTRFLRASLYSAWRLKEAEAELDALSSQLEKPESTKELDKIYTTITRRTGDLFLKIDQKDKGMREYERTINPPPQAGAEGQPGRLDEKAIAHSRLADLYLAGGNKAKAEANFKAAKSIYLTRGKVTKAKAMDQKMRVRDQ